MKRNFNYMVRTSYEDETVEALVIAFIDYMHTVEGKAIIQNNDGIIAIEDWVVTTEKEKQKIFHKALQEAKRTVEQKRACNYKALFIII